jgi:hypothetical protein
MTVYTLCVPCSLDAHRNQGRPCIYAPAVAPYRCPWCLTVVIPLKDPATWRTTIELAVEHKAPGTHGFVSMGHAYMPPLTDKPDST